MSEPFDQQNIQEVDVQLGSRETDRRSETDDVQGGIFFYIGR